MAKIIRASGVLTDTIVGTAAGVAMNVLEIADPSMTLAEV